MRLFLQDNIDKNPASIYYNIVILKRAIHRLSLYDKDY